MPTPRPDTSLTTSAVEKPGAKIRLKTRSSDSSSFAPTRPRSRALARILSLLQAAAVVADFDDHVAALVIRVQLMTPCAGLPAASAHFGHLDAVVDGVAHQVHQRVADLLEHGLVELGRCRRSPCSSIFLPSRWPRSRTRRGKRLNTKLMGNMRTRMTLSCSARMWRSSCAERGAQLIRPRGLRAARRAGSAPTG